MHNKIQNVQEKLQHLISHYVFIETICLKYTLILNAHKSVCITASHIKL